MTRTRTSTLLSALFLLPGILMSGVNAEETTDASASKPAVDGINGKLSFEKAVDGYDAHGVSGALTIPIGHRFGLQVDGMVAEYDSYIFGDVPVFAAAAHAFWRDPSKGLLGLYADYSYADVYEGFSLSSASLGIEGSLYLDRFTLDAIIGGKDGDIFGSTLFDRVRLSYYPTDDLQLHIGHAYSYGHHSLRYGLEWAFAGHAGAASTLYADGSVGEDGTHAAGLGMRFYFGQHDKTLIRRHREDDPPMAPNTVAISIADGGNYTWIIGNTGNPNGGGVIYGNYGTLLSYYAEQALAKRQH